jgi:hypothetical protein
VEAGRGRLVRLPGPTTPAEFERYLEGATRGIVYSCTGLTMRWSEHSTPYVLLPRTRPSSCWTWRWMRFWGRSVANHRSLGGISSSCGCWPPPGAGGIGSRVTIQARCGRIRTEESAPRHPDLHLPLPKDCSCPNRRCRWATHTAPPAASASDIAAAGNATPRLAASTWPCPSPAACGNDHERPEQHTGGLVSRSIGSSASALLGWRQLVRPFSPRNSECS